MEVQMIAIINATLRLFHGLPIGDKPKRKCSDKFLSKTIPLGFILSSEVIDHYTDSAIEEIITSIATELAVSPQQLNSTFHKSWNKVVTASAERLVVEQILHYISVYESEHSEAYNSDCIYIPSEALDIPEITDKLSITIIHGYTIDELKSKILTLLSSGIALKENTLEDIITIADVVNVTSEDIESIRNKEAMAIFCDKIGLLPHDPVEFLRLLVYKLTGKTLLIKSKDMITEIRCSQKGKSIARLLKKYDETYGLHRLGEIFYRFKPIFLAIRKLHDDCRSMVNYIRRMAKKHHKPMQEDYLNSITKYITMGIDLQEDKIRAELKRVNVFRQIRLMHALQYRMSNSYSILYRIRNGKGFATEIKPFSYEQRQKAQSVLDMVVNEIASSIAPAVANKKIYIPDFVCYGVPASEKQFLHGFPFGTSIAVPMDMLIGIHWKNSSDTRIDLDLSITSLGQKIGWDGDYRSSGSDILFSGDVIDAPPPDGATEVIRISLGVMKDYLVNVNDYTRRISNVPFNLIIARSNSMTAGNNNEENKACLLDHIVDPNLVVASIPLVVEKQQVVGLLTTRSNDLAIYLGGIHVGNGISMRHTAIIEHVRQYLMYSRMNAITFNDLFVKAGAILLDSPDDADIDLSLENIERDTFVKLLLSRE